MSRRVAFRCSRLALALAALALIVQAPAAQASSGSIGNVHSVGGEVEATYTTNFDICTGTYCGWFAHAYQYPAAQSCAPNGSHLTYVGELHSTSGSETASDRFTPAYSGTIRICLYAYHSGNDYFIAEATFTPPSSISGAITNVHSTGGGNAQATYTTNFDMCTGGYCGWFAHAYQYPAGQSCAPNGSHLTYVGDLHSSSGSETASDDFRPESSAVRLCLYAYHAGQDFFVAEAVYFSGPAPSRSVQINVGDQKVWFYFPKSCVFAGNEIQLRVKTQTNKKLVGKKPATRIKRVVFSLDLSKRTDKKKAWQASFPTTGFAPGSTHKTIAKITFKQKGKSKKLTKTIRKSFRIC